MNPEFSKRSFGGMVVRDLVGQADGIQRRMKGEGHPVSLKVALALSFGEVGRGMLKSATAPVVSGPVAENLESILKKMKRDQKRQFLMGLGGICLGCIIRSLESAVWDGWDDRIFVDFFNLAISGTSIPGLRLEDLEEAAKGMSSSRRTVEEETSIIRAELQRDNTFLGFFEKENREKLPQTIQALTLGKYISAGLLLVLPVYKEAVTQL